MFSNPLTTLARQPDLVPILKRILEIDTAKRATAEEQGQDYDGFEWHDVGVEERLLNRLLTMGLLRAGYRSRAFRYFKVADPLALGEAIESLEGGRTEPPLEIPEDLFSVIEGYPHVKSLLRLALMASAPVHVLLVGPPGSGKSLFQEELCRLPGSRFALGGLTTKAGLVDYLLSDRPRYLIVDEIEYLHARDQVALLSLMATGTIARLKHGADDLDRLQVWVFAGCNSARPLRDALRDRFKEVTLRAYTDAEYTVVVRAVLTEREGVDPELAGYIAFKLKGRTFSVREAVRFGRMCKSRQEVDSLLGGFPIQKE